MQEQINVLSQTTLKLNSSDKKLFEDIKAGKNVHHTHGADIDAKELARLVSDGVQKEIREEVNNIIKVDTKALQQKVDEVSKAQDKELANAKKREKYFKYGVIGLLMICIVLTLITSFAGGLFDFIGLDGLQQVMLSKMKQSHGFIVALLWLGYVILPFIWLGAFLGALAFIWRKVDI